MAAVTLAESRKREKWCEDPRNTKWSNDTTRFGYRMLEKMGWSKGKGLGTKEDGALEHTKLSVKKDNLGLGAKRGRDDDWMEQQTEFDQILAQLAREHESVCPGADCDGEETTPPVPSRRNDSAEHCMFKPAVNGKRLKYSKVLRSKDLSDKRAEDVDCILGKRRKKKHLNKCN